jgi:hypothetical protein
VLASKTIPAKINRDLFWPGAVLSHEIILNDSKIEKGSHGTAP